MTMLQEMKLTDMKGYLNEVLEAVKKVKENHIDCVHPSKLARVFIEIQI